MSMHEQIAGAALRKSQLKSGEIRTEKAKIRAFKRADSEKFLTVGGKSAVSVPLMHDGKGGIDRAFIDKKNEKTGVVERFYLKGTPFNVGRNAAKRVERARVKATKGLVRVATGQGVVR